MVYLLKFQHEVQCILDYENCMRAGRTIQWCMLSKQSASSRGNNVDRLNLQSVGKDGNAQSSASQWFFREGGQQLFRSSQVAKQYSFAENERNSHSYEKNR